MKALVSIFLSLCLLLFVAAFIAPYFVAYDWRLDVFAHGQLYLFYALLIFGVFLLPFKRKWLLLAWGALFVYAALTTLQFPNTRSTQQEPLKAIFFNLHTQNKQHEAIMAWIQEEDPDFIVFAEFDGHYETTFQPLRKNYPFFHIAWKPAGFGLALYSKFNYKELPRTHGGEPTLTVLMDSPQGMFTLLGVHPISPKNKGMYRMRNSQYESIAGTIQSLQAPVLTVGDFNCTPWSTHFKGLLEDSGLNRFKDGFAPPATWFGYHAYAGIPIDHALFKGGIQPVSYNVGPDLGSDHLPFIIDFTVLEPLEVLEEDNLQGDNQ